MFRPWWVRCFISITCITVSKINNLTPWEKYIIKSTISNTGKYYYSDDIRKSLWQHFFCHTFIKLGTYYFLKIFLLWLTFWSSFSIHVFGPFYDFVDSWQYRVRQEMRGKGEELMTFDTNLNILQPTLLLKGMRGADVIGHYWIWPSSTCWYWIMHLPISDIMILPPRFSIMYCKCMISYCITQVVLWAVCVELKKVLFSQTKNLQAAHLTLGFCCVWIL